MTHKNITRWLACCCLGLTACAWPEAGNKAAVGNYEVIAEDRELLPVLGVDGYAPTIKIYENGHFQVNYFPIRIIEPEWKGAAHIAAEGKWHREKDTIFLSLEHRTDKAEAISIEVGMLLMYRGEKTSLHFIDAVGERPLRFTRKREV